MSEQPKDCRDHYYIVSGLLLDRMMTNADNDELESILFAHPHPAPASDHRTYETCHKHFSCPDGEECWYLSEDYYWDCGNGASRVSEASQRAARKARGEFIEQIEDKLPRYPSSLGDMYLLSDIQGLAPQQAGEP